MKSRKEAFEDAISATKAAIAEGIVPGGGLALLRAIDAVEKEEANSDGDERTGLRILRRALEAPTRQSPRTPASTAASSWMHATGRATTASTPPQEYVDLIEAGIIDPTKVVRIALENAVSVAGVLLLTEATLTEIPEDKKERSLEPGMAM